MSNVELIQVNKKGDTMKPNELSNLIADIQNCLFIYSCRIHEQDEVFAHKNGETYILVHQCELNEQLSKLARLKKMLSIEV